MPNFVRPNQFSEQLCCHLNEDSSIRWIRQGVRNKKMFMQRGELLN
ncbi:hypothetical protein [Lysinibacillus xylanilyticus]